MILGLFKKTYFTQISWVVVFAIILAIPGYFQSTTDYIPSNTLFLKISCLYPWLQINWVYQTITQILLLILAFYIKSVFSKHELVHRQNFLPSLLVLALFNFAHPFQYQLYAVVNLLLLSLSFSFLLSSLEDEKPDNSIFSTSFFLSLATLISYSNIIFLPFIWISFLIFRNYSLRYFLMTIIALIIPYLFLFTWLFWFEKIALIGVEWDSILNHLFQIVNYSGLYNIISLSILGFFTFASLAKILPGIASKTISIRLKTIVSLWFLVFSIYPLFFYYDIVSNNFFIIPLSGLLGYYLRMVKNRRLWIDLLFTLFIIIIILNKYFYASEIFF